ncbi:MAG: WG repeat-containing protein [Alistipes sp.]|nr:WG repeat-containing protein [Alistipes sp.]
MKISTPVVILTFLTGLLAANALTAQAAEPEIPTGERFEWVISPRYSEIRHFWDSDIAPVEFWDDQERRYRYFYIDRDENPVMEFKYEYLGPFFEGRAVVGNSGGPYGVIDRDGNLVADVIYEDLKYYKEGLCPFFRDGYGGFLDMDGNEVISWPGIFPGLFSDGYAVFYDSESEMVGVLDKEGHMVISPVFERLGPYSDGLLPAEDSDGMCGFIDIEGNWIVEPVYDYVQVFSEGRGAVYKDGKWGFVDTEGNIAVDLVFDYIIRPFSNGLASVEMDGLSGCVDRDGNLVIQHKFKWIDSFSDGYAFAAVPQNNNYGVIDKAGNWVVEPCFDVVTIFVKGLATVRVGQKWGMIRITD